MLTVKVKDFGPIVEGEVRLRPLTIFVGPNNSGKSYLAMLTYGMFASAFPDIESSDLLLSVLRDWSGKRFRRGLFQPRGIASHGEVGEDSALQTLLNPFTRWLRERQFSAEDGVQFSFGELPDAMQQILIKIVEEDNQEFFYTLRSELRRCFGTEISGLNRSLAKSSALEFSLAQEEPFWNLTVSSQDSELQMLSSRFDLSNQLLSMSGDLLQPFQRPHIRKSIIAAHFGRLLDSLITMTLVSFYGSFAGPAFYLPAARSGILQSHKALASFMVRRSPLVGIESWTEIPRLTGVVADFISNLLTLERDRQTDIYSVAQFLESEIVHGAISLEAEATNLEYPEIYYTSQVGKFPLHRTSSIVSELAPVVLFLRHLVHSRDLLIIEEPEAHLHPKSQRKLAQAIAKLIRAGVHVLITTHSDYFVAQLSNFIRLGHVTKRERAKRGYGDDDYLTAEEVGAYLFDYKPDEGGTFVRELPVNVEDGISEEGFIEVDEALYDEMVYLRRKVSS